MSISQLTNYGQIAVLNWLFTTNAMSGSNSRPTAWYLALSTTVPNTTAQLVTEPIGNGYSRKSVVFTQPSGNPAVTYNTALIQFTANGGDFGNILYALIYDSLTQGNCWAMGPLVSPKLIQNGDTLQFQASSVAISNA